MATHRFKTSIPEMQKAQKGKSQKGQKAQKGAERTFLGWSAKKIGERRGGSTGG